MNNKIQNEIQELQNIKGGAKRLNDEIENKLIEKGYFFYTLGRSRKRYISSGEIKVLEVDGEEYICYGVANSMYKYRAFMKPVKSL